VTILDLFDASLADRAGALAFNDATYSEVNAGSLRVAARLNELGLRRGDRLALYVENRISFVYAYLAALRLGAIAVPANVLYRTSDLQHVLENSGAAFVVVSEQTRAHALALPSPPAIVDAGDVEEWAIDAAIEPAIPVRPSPDDVATIIYTSGTTGRSKGAMLTHGNLAAIASAIVVAWRWRAEDSLLVALPLFHMHGLGAALNGTLAAGARIVVHERFDARAILDALRTGEYTMFFGVPTMYVRMLEAAGDAPVPPLRLYVSGSAALSPDVHAAFAVRFGAQILERYGATEFGFALTNRYAGPRVPGAVGVPTPGTRVTVVAPGGLDRVSPDEVGELLVAGPTVCAGYWEAPEATAAAFAADSDGTRWYRTGDLARYDSEHDVYRIVGRIKELIISGGFNIYPREIEAEIERYAGVRACAVVGVPDAARGELPVAFVECDPGFDADALLGDLRTKLASFKIPKSVRIVEVLPRNALGKIEKARLRDGSFE
jgi:acyl-CoA synthetase (AMP-forming)/AMP-acid ligase II